MMIILENRLSPTRMTSWVSMGMPTPLLQDSGADKWVKLVSGKREFPAVASGKELHVLATLESRERLIGTLVDAMGPPKPFSFHPYVADAPTDLIPIFMVDGLASKPMTLFTGQSPKPADFIEIESADAARVRWHFRTRIPAAAFTIEGWMDCYSGQPWVEFKIRISWGTTNPGSLTGTFGSFSMLTGEQPHLDWRVRKGLHVPMWRQDLKRWEAELAVPNAWLRARTVEILGALICREKGKTNFDLMLPDQEARTYGPIEGIVAGSEWIRSLGRFGAFQVPKRPADAATEQARRANSMLSRLQTPSSEYETRLYAQPPNSGQTGEQPDFGATRSEHLTGFSEPWARFDLRYSVQAWMLRPYANREPDGSPVQAVNHPGAQLYNLRPDERFGSDHLGWPKPVGWISGYTTSDSQHRSDNLLWSMWLHTRCPSIKRTITDLIELEKMSMKGVEPAVGSGVGSPRGWGRPLLSWCQGLATGDFPEFEPMIREQVRRMHKAASYRSLTLNPALTVRVLSSNESKYGWNNEAGTPIRAWLPWQESIALQGAFGAWELLRIPEAREMCIIVGQTIARHAFFQSSDGRWRYCYAVRWREDEPGMPLDPSRYNLNQPNYDVFVTGDTQRWAIPALAILARLDPDGPVTQRALEILTAIGSNPRNWDDSCWWAFTP